LDAMIELDPSIPWDPPQASPPPSVRARRRWIALVAVALTTAGTLVAAGPRVSTEPVFTVDDARVLSVSAGGGRLIVGRYQPDGVGTRAEVLSLRDGTRLWSMPLGVDQRLTFLTDNVMALVDDTPAGTARALNVLDAATGARLWQRAGVAYLGELGGRILAEDVTDGVEETRIFGGDPFDEAAVNPVPEQRDRHYVALDERTGAKVWELRVPKGSFADFSWVDYAGAAFMSELSPTGLLRIRDLGTGGVVAEHRLDWSGTISWLAMDGPLLGSGSVVPGQVQIAKAGERGRDIYDRGTGRLLWHWQPEPSGASGGGDLYRCATDLYCVRDGSGLAALDPRTGERLWHADGYSGVLDVGGGVLVAGLGRPDSNAGAAPVVVADARTGRIVRELKGWHLTWIISGPRLVMWKSVDDRTTVLGVVDPRSGRTTVFGRSTRWQGDAECHQDRDMVACLINGALSVWKLR
jgi:outer membrane protein assembly factor BamB